MIPIPGNGFDNKKISLNMNYRTADLSFLTQRKLWIGRNGNDKK